MPALALLALRLLVGGVVANLILGVTLVLAAAVAGLMAYHYAQAKLRERRGYTFDPTENAVTEEPEGAAAVRAKSAEEIAHIRERIETLMEEQNLRSETQSQHLAQRLDDIRQHMGGQDRKLDGLKSELRHEIRRRDGELDELRGQLASALDAFWKAMPALPEGAAAAPLALPAAPETPAPAAPPPPAPAEPRPAPPAFASMADLAVEPVMSAPAPSTPAPPAPAPPAFAPAWTTAEAPVSPEPAPPVAPPPAVAPPAAAPPAPADPSPSWADASTWAAVTSGDGPPSGDSLPPVASAAEPPASAPAAPAAPAPAFASMDAYFTPGEQAPPVPPDAEDLTLIRGIDAATQQKLYAAGVYHLDEMARWSRADARRISGAVGVPEETIMHEWIFEAQSVLFDSYQQQLTPPVVSA